MKPLSEVALRLLIIQIQIIAVCKDWICFHKKLFHLIMRKFAQMSHDLVILSLFEWNGAHDKFLGWSQGLLFLLHTFCASNLGSFFTVFRIPIENTFREISFCKLFTKFDPRPFGFLTKGRWI